MHGQTILSLITAPFYGLFAALMVLPVTLAGGVLVVVASYFVYFLLAIPILLLFLLFLAILVQSGRFAAALTGLQRFSGQGDLVSALGRCVLPTLCAMLFMLVLAGSVFLIFAEIDDGRELWWYSRERLDAALFDIRKNPGAAARYFALENLNLGPVAYILQGSLLCVISGLAIFMLPRAIDLRGWYDDAYSTGLLAVRFFIALPFFAALVWVLGEIATTGIHAVIALNAGENVILLFVRAFVEASVFAAIVLTFEAMIVRNAVRYTERVRAAIKEMSRVDSDEYRTLRESWKDRP